MSDDHAPIVDAADNVSAFLSLPVPMQQAAIMVVYAARDVPTDEIEGIRDLLKRLAAEPAAPLSRRGRHYLEMATTPITNARFHFRRESYEED